MIQRERTLAIIVGSAVGLTVFYQAINFLFIRPLERAEDELAQLESDANRYDGIIRSRLNLAERWRTAAGKTFSHDFPQTTNLFGQDLKEVAKRHGFENAIFSPTNGTKIGSTLGAKTGISTVAYRVVAQGRKTQAMEFLKDLYRSTYLSQMTKLSAAPVQQKDLPLDTVKIEFTIETPVLPVIDRKDLAEAAGTTTMPGDGDPSLEPARDDVQPDEAFALLERRNIFKRYVPPPTNVVMIDNQDWKTVAVRLKFSWDEEVKQQLVETVSSKSQQAVKGTGDIVEIEGSYADGKTFGPELLKFSDKKDWTYTVDVHHPPPPPEVVILAVENKDKGVVDVEVVLTMPDGKLKTYPPMRVQPGSKVDVDEYKVKSLTATAAYASGVKAAPVTFTPKAEPQVYVVPAEPAATAVVQRDVRDPEPNAQYTVTGLVTYPSEGRIVQEMIATATGTDRLVITAGEQGIVDGGTLLAVHPLGGVVKMPSGNYYIYPWGKKFTERVKLDAASDQDLPQAIDAWVLP